MLSPAGDTINSFIFTVSMRVFMVLMAGGGASLAAPWAVSRVAGHGFPGLAGATIVVYSWVYLSAYRRFNRFIIL